MKTIKNPMQLVKWLNKRHIDHSNNSVLCSLFVINVVLDVLAECENADEKLIFWNKAKDLLNK